MPRRARPVLALLAWSCALGCSSADRDESAPQTAASAGATASDWTAALREPSVETTLAALAQPHAAIRDALGPHRLRFVLEVALDDPSTEDDEALPELDAPAVLDDRVRDELELVWAPDAGGAPRFSLRQTNDRDRGREVILVDGRLHTRELHRAWESYEVETDLHEQWLDEAQRAVHDVVELAAPRLRVGAKGSAGEHVTLELGLAENANGSLRRPGAVSSWRDGAQIQQVTGEIAFDAASGAWRSANIDVRYALEAADGRTLRGMVRLEASVEPLSAGSADLRAPPDSTPLAERTRLQAERQELLDALAPPR